MPNRLGPRDRGYDVVWEKLRKRFLAGRPRCAVYGCGERAIHVDHVVSVKADPSRRLDPSNLQGLCQRHHNVLTSAYDRGSIAGACDDNGLPLDPGHPWAQTTNAGALKAVRDAETGVGGTETGKGPSPAVAALVGRLKRRAVRRR